MCGVLDGVFVDVLVLLLVLWEWEGWVLWFCYLRVSVVILILGFFLG